MIKHNGGELLLKEILQGLLLSKDWYQVKKFTSEMLYELQKPGLKTGVPKLDNLTQNLRFLLYLDLVGPEIRELWGEEAENAYKPELLREPYLTAQKRNELTRLANRVLHASIEAITQVDHHDRSGEEHPHILDAKYKYFVTTKMRAQSLLKRKFDIVPPQQLREDLGNAISGLLREEDVLVRLLATPLTPESAYDPRKFDNVDDMHYKFGGGAHAGLTAEEQGEQAVEDVIDKFSPEMMNKMCLMLRGVVMSHSLREDIWGYRYLSRLPHEAPSAVGVSAVRELSRRSAQKGYDVSSTRGLERSNMLGAISASVDNAIAEALPITLTTDAAAGTASSAAGSGYGASTSKSRPDSSQGSYGRNNGGGSGSASSFGSHKSQSSQSEVSVLAARARHMVHAVYALNDEFSPRSVLVSVLLLYIFPQEPPTAEKLLRIYHRIAIECLPSEQLHHDFSIATVAHHAWALLLERDPELARFLQNYKVSHLRSSSATGSGSGSTRAGSRPGSQDNGKESANTKKGGDDGAGLFNKDPDAADADDVAEVEVPRSLLLLRGWLRDGFLGWVGGHTALYLWDQLTLFDAAPSNFKTMLPIYCCILLRAMRSELMKLPPGQDLIEAMRINGRKLRTKAIIEAVRREPNFKELAPPKAQRPANAPDADTESPTGHGAGMLSELQSNSVKSLIMSRSGRSGSAGGGGKAGLYGMDAVNHALKGTSSQPENALDSQMVTHTSGTSLTQLSHGSGRGGTGAGSAAASGVLGKKSQRGGGTLTGKTGADDVGGDVNGVAGIEDLDMSQLNLSGSQSAVSILTELSDAGVEVRSGTATPKESSL